MAFLDNSGDIILDAVLTNEGRKLLATGKFKITKFQCGDDEINYTQYDKNNPSGSAYYDLSILQTPIMEANGSVTGIQYGLRSLKDGLYNMVTLAATTKAEMQTAGAALPYREVYWIPDTSNDTTTYQINSVLSDGNIDYISGDGNPLHYLFVEGGIASSNALGDASNQQLYVTNNQLYDNNLLVSYDSRIFGSMMQGVGSVANNAPNNALNAKVNMQNASRTSQAAVQMNNYSTSRITTMKNQIYNTNTGVDTASKYSMFSGPRSMCAAVAPVLLSNMQPQYSLMGQLNQTVSGVSRPIDYIDTTLYMQGATTGQSLQVTLRVARLA